MAKTDTSPFMTITRRPAAYRPIGERLHDYQDVAILRSDDQSQEQASRCLDCGLPFCHWSCPTGNDVPRWNQHLAAGRWDEAFRLLQATNNIPEITGRLCPALCEAACVLRINDEPVTVRENELAILEHAFQAGWVAPHLPSRRTGQSVAVIGSGPAGLCCAAQLNQAGHRVTVFERDDKAGGLLRYGIPDFKLEKWIIDRRLAIWGAEGIEFVTGVHVGLAYPAAKLLRRFDAICLAGGSRTPRDLPIEGRALSGIYFAMDYLVQSNRHVAGISIPAQQLIHARGKRVVVIGGGDTGADCVGTAHRQGAAQVVQLELLPRPPEQRGPRDLWPDYPTILKTSTSHEEGGRREWSVLTKQFLGTRGAVTKLSCVRVKSVSEPGRPPRFEEIPGSDFEIDTDLVLLALGFVSAERPGLLQELGVQLNARGCIDTNARYQTSVPRVFSAGDIRRGQSLIVHAVSEGRRAAHAIDEFLTGHSSLPDH